MRALIFILLLSVLSGVNSEFCPNNCECIFNSNISYNSASCRTDNNSIFVNWNVLNVMDYGPEMVIRCEGYEDVINCSEIPHFTISPRRLKVSSCPTSLLECINAIITDPPPVATIQLLEIQNLTGPYKNNYFQEFKNVTTVIVNFPDSLKHMPIAPFNALPKVREVYVNGGNFELDRNTFLYTPALDKVYFLNNNMNVLEVPSFQGLTCSILHIEGNNIENIRAQSFEETLFLTELHIINTKLKYIEADAFSSKTLKHLLLQKNRLAFLPNGLLRRLPKLEEVRILGNEVDITLDTHVFSAVSKSVSLIEFSGSQLHNLSNTLFANSYNLKTLKMRKAKIKELPRNIFRDLISLTTLILSGNNLKYISEDVFTNLKNLKYLDLSSNQLANLNDNQFSSTPNLKVLLLDYNKLTQISVISFNGTNLKTLSIVDNELSTIKGDTAVVWKSLQYLNLSDNDLRSFEDIIYGLTKLMKANFSKNKIISIRENDTYFTGTKLYLDLSHNKISHVIRDANSKNNFIGRSFILKLNNNELNCDCLLTKVLREWNKAGILEAFENITCNNKEFVSKIDLHLLCKNIRIITASTGYPVIVGFLLIMILLPIMIHWKKIWNYTLTFFNYWKSERKSNSSASIEIEDDEPKIYDIFISYAQEDKEFVEHQLKSQLERECALTVLSNYRKIVAGETLSNQSKDAAECSKFFVIVLTESYLKYKHLLLEFKIAYDLNREESLPKLILILFDESITQDERITADLKMYMSVNTYLSAKDPRFWIKLNKILPKRE